MWIVKNLQQILRSTWKPSPHGCEIHPLTSYYTEKEHEICQEFHFYWLSKVALYYDSEINTYHPSYSIKRSEGDQNCPIQYANQNICCDCWKNSKRLGFDQPTKMEFPGGLNIDSLNFLYYLKSGVVPRHPMGVIFFGQSIKIQLLADLMFFLYYLKLGVVPRNHMGWFLNTT